MQIAPPSELIAATDLTAKECAEWRRDHRDYVGRKAPTGSLLMTLVANGSEMEWTDYQVLRRWREERQRRQKTEAREQPNSPIVTG